MRDVIVAGAGMTRFGKLPGTGVRDFAVKAAADALADADIDQSRVERIFFGNAVAPTVSHQDMVKGQVAFRHTPLAHVPIINVENACASGSSALKLAYEAVATGLCDVALAVGAEQLSHVERERTFTALRGAMDIGEIGEVDLHEHPEASAALMEGYAAEGRELIRDYGAELADFARVAVKNRRHASMNPRAHFRTPLTLDEVLASREIAPSLTLPMCSPVSDGAAAVVVCSRGFAARHGISGPRILATCIAPGTGKGSSPVADAARKAYETAGVGIGDIDVVELHDAAAPAELIQYGDLGLCGVGEGHHIIRKGETELGGRIPVNVSGGLMSRGHPLGATGCAQIFELYSQLKGRADNRQVDGAQIALAANSGGWVGDAYAVAVVTILSSVH